MIRRFAIFTAALLGCVATAAAQPPPPSPQRPSQDAPAPFRVSVDVVAVDVQVIDRDGNPVADLGPEKFNVTINGRRRRVVSAERIGGDAGRGALASSPTPLSTGRVIMLAVDCVSFNADATRGVIQAVRQFVQQLSPDDYVGLSAYPNGPKLDPTKDHAAVLTALQGVIGQRDLAEISQFHVRPSELVDMTREIYRGGGPRLDAISARECGNPPDPFCAHRLITDVSGTALYYEGEATASLNMLRSIVEQMGGFLGRKTLVLISGGMIASDTPGGRPDLADLGIRVGKEAALANTAIYTLFLDASFLGRFSAETRTGDKSLDNWNRDSALLAGWLGQFSGAAGGALFTVQVGNAETALARVGRELSSYYLLGVEPADEDRDGRTHEIAVKTTEPRVTVRGRRWVMVPKRGTPATAAAAAKPEPAAAAAAADIPAPPPRRPVPVEVQTLADAYDRGSYDAVTKMLAQSKDLANVIRAFRSSDSPWPNAPQRTAVFALEMALAGLRSDNAYARDEGGRLLGEYHTRVRQPAGADAFECQWFYTEAAALEGLFMPESALLFVPRALQRCADNPRLHLAYAFVSEQQWLRGGMTTEQKAEVVTRYEAAIKFPNTAVEARIRAARMLVALGDADRAIALLDNSTRQAADKEMRYFAHLVLGQALRAKGRSDEAAAAYRAALDVWPGAQSARVALMTLLVAAGKHDDAAALADAAQAAGDDVFDPWWTYWLGDFRDYPAILARLREMGR